MFFVYISLGHTSFRSLQLKKLWHFRDIVLSMVYVTVHRDQARLVEERLVQTRLSMCSSKRYLYSRLKQHLKLLQSLGPYLVEFPSIILLGLFETSLCICQAWG